ncbi:MAG: S8 family serine peptidase [Kiritimatiellae bacterium]|nr:S8 family serine peptidase [Kiritimatiellia bacterium]
MSIGRALVFFLAVVGLCGAQTPSAIRFRNGTLDTSLSAATRMMDAKTEEAYVDEASISALQPSLLDGFIPVLAQFSRPITTADRQALACAGATVVNYVPDQALLLLIRSDAVPALQRMAGIRWIGAYPAEMKLDESLLPSPVSGPVLRMDAAGDAVAEVVISVLRPRYVHIISSLVEEDLGGEVVDTGVGSRWGTVRARVAVSLLEELTARSEVEWIEPYLQPELHNNVAVGSELMNVRQVWTNYGLTGAGQIVAVGDSGLDTGNPDTIHPDFSNRIHAAFGLVSAGDWIDYNGHGTHTSGSVLGNGAAYSNGLFRGVAYEAELVIQALGSTTGGSSVYPPSPLTLLFTQAHSNDARIHSDSWGDDADGAYSSMARYVDEFMWDVDDMLVVFSAGNSGEDADQDGVIDLGSMGAPGTAKNCLTVGAAETDRPAGSGGYSSDPWGTGSWLAHYPTNPIRDDLISTPWDGTNQGMAAFSSRGPCRDQRIKPDIVAPGTDIISCRSRQSGAGVLWGTGTGILANSASNEYCFSGGTSMSTPLTAGSAALVRQYLVEQRGLTNPSAALLKGLLINGARSLSPGQYGEGEFLEVPAGPNNVEGWGHVNLADSLFPEDGRTLLLADRHYLQTGLTNRYPVVLTSTAPLTVTLAWSDYPAALSSAQQLVNDLDLRLVEPDGTVLYPNGSTGPDHTNNVERLDVTEGKIGTNWIEVSGFNVPQGPQSCALVIKADGFPAPVLELYGLCADPANPLEREQATVHVGVSSLAGGLAAVVTSYRVNSNAWEYLLMTPAETNDWMIAYEGVLPAFDAGDIVDFSLYAMTFEFQFAFSTTNQMLVNSTNIWVCISGSSEWPYNTWETAYTTIQEALDAAEDGYVITVADGHYKENTLMVEKDVVLHSESIMGSVMIDGQNQRICMALLSSGARVQDFKFVNGYAVDGAGVYMTGGTLSSCIVDSCSADRYGGGIYLAGGTVSDCIVRDCHSGRYAGGILTLGGLVEHTLIYDNDSVSDGGGMEFWGGVVSNCTVAFNQSGGTGGGIDVGDYGFVYNTIIVSNTAVNGGNNWYEWTPKDFRYCCSSPNPGEPGGIDVDPLFVDAPIRDLRLKSELGHYVPNGTWTNDAVTSPCIDMGDPASDYSAEPEPNGGRINMGVYGGAQEASKGDTNTYKLIVVSSQDGTDPAPGVYAHPRGAGISCMLTNSLITGVSTQYVGLGWSLSGLLDSEGESSGTDTVVSLTLTNSGLLSWGWQTNVFGMAYANLHGSVSGTSGEWYAINSSMTLQAFPESYYGFTAWTGTATSTANPYAVPMTQAQEVWAVFDALRTTSGVPQWWLAQYGWTNGFETAASADPDEDGAPTGDEYYAGTSPTNEYSVLQLVTTGGGDEPVILSWRAMADRTYTLQYSTNLLEGMTNRLFQFYTALSLDMVLEDDTHTNEQSLYYRIKVRYDE